MKIKISLLSTLMIICALSLSAQISIGLHGSYGNAWQNYGDDFTPPNGPLTIESFQINASVYHPVSNVLSVGLEPGYSRRGAACEPGFIGGNVFLVQDATFYANYVQLPLMLRAELPLFSTLRVSGKIGAGPSFMTKAYRDIIFLDPERPMETEPVVFDSGTEDVNRWDLGGYAGIGIGLPLGPGVVQLEGNYYYGLLDSSAVITSLNRGLRFGIGYTISL